MPPRPWPGAPTCGPPPCARSGGWPRQGWWRRAPYLPLPDPAYLHFRMVTAYGGQGGEPAPADVVTYLHWCKAWPEVTSGH